MILKTKTKAKIIVTQEVKVSKKNLQKAFLRDTMNSVTFVMLSNHPDYQAGNRFDLGFWRTAIEDGYTIISLPKDEK